MSLIERAQAILLRPKETWPVIAAESADVASIFKTYLCILAAIPAVCGFIGHSVVGAGAFGVSYRLPIVTGIVQAIVTYVLSLIIFFVVSLIVDALAPTFGGAKSGVQAFKLVAYGSTAVLVASVLMIVPSALLSLVIFLALLYSIYLFYVGVPVLMRCPPEKAAAYTAVVVVCWLVVGAICFAVLALFVPGGYRGVAVGAADMTLKTPDGATVTINPERMAEIARRMEAAAPQSRAAQDAADPAAAGKAVGAMVAAMTGGQATPIPAADLKSMLPESIGELTRTSYEASGGQAMGIAATSAKASYGNGERRVDLSITDTGGLAGMAAMAGWANMTMDKESDGKVEKVYKEGARTMHEAYRKDGSQGEATAILGNGVIVAAEGRHVDIDTLKKVLAGVDLGRIEAMKRAAK